MSVTAKYSKHAKTETGTGGCSTARSHGYASTNGNWYAHNFYHADGNGNILYLVNSSQTKAAAYRYDPFGNMISSSGSLASANMYRFSSKEIHARSGLYYYGYRFYDPDIQTWLNRDPIGETGGMNLYEFVRNAPTGSVDNYGLLVAPPPPVVIEIPPLACAYAVGLIGIGVIEGISCIIWPEPDPSPLPLPPSWKKIDPAKAKAERECHEELESYKEACKKLGSPLTKEEKKERWEECMERKGFPVKK